MRARILFVAACLLGAVGMAQSINSTSTTATVSGPVQVAAPDGGLRVTLAPEEVGVNILTAPRLEAAVSMEPGTFLAVAGDTDGTILRTEATGAAGGPVVAQITGTPTVLLGGSAMALLAGQRNCTYTPLGNPRVDAGYPTALPRVFSQTGITIQAHNFGNQVDYVSCWPETLDAGPLPNCANGGIGYAIHSGGAIDLDLTGSQRVHCVSCAHGGGGGAQGADIAGGVTACIP